MDARKISEHLGRDIFFDQYCHKYYVWNNGKKIHRVTKEAVIKFIDANVNLTGAWS